MCLRSQLRNWPFFFLVTVPGITERNLLKMVQCQFDIYVNLVDQWRLGQGSGGRGGRVGDGDDGNSCCTVPCRVVTGTWGGAIRHTTHTHPRQSGGGERCCSFVARHTSNMTPCNATEYMQISIRAENQNKAKTNNVPLTRIQSFVLGPVKGREQCHTWWSHVELNLT
jgi:hypothetical protein